MSCKRHWDHFVICLSYKSGSFGGGVHLLADHLLDVADALRYDLGYHLGDYSSDDFFRMSGGGDNFVADILDIGRVIFDERSWRLDGASAFSVIAGAFESLIGYSFGFGDLLLLSQLFLVFRLPRWP